MEENPKNKRQNPFWSKAHNSFSKYAVIATALFIIFITFISNDNLIRWFKARSEWREQEETKAWLKKDNAAKQEFYDNITNQPDTLEAFARGKGYAVPGDDVYQIDESRLGK